MATTSPIIPQSALSTSKSMLGISNASMLGVSNASNFTLQFRSPELISDTYFKTNIIYEGLTDFHVCIFQKMYPNFDNKHIGAVTCFINNSTSQLTYLAFKDLEVKKTFDDWFFQYSKFFNSEEEAKTKYFPEITGNIAHFIPAKTSPSYLIYTSDAMIGFNNHLTSTVEMGSNTISKRYYLELIDDWVKIIKNCSNPVSVVRAENNFYWVFSDEEDAVKFKLLTNT